MSVERGCGGIWENGNQNILHEIYTYIFYIRIYTYIYNFLK